MSIISLDHVTIRFGDTIALNDLSLNVEEGELFGLLGPNGAGKTTAISVMLNLYEADSGSIRIFGQSMPKDELSIKRRVGIVPQHVSVYDQLTVYENIQFFAELYGFSPKEARQKTEVAIAFVELDAHQKKRPPELSGGLLRRLNIACGIVHGPELIFMDEPTVATTARTQAFFGLLSFIMMSTFLQFIPMFVADDRDEKIYARLFASPVSPRRYFASLLLAFYLVGFVYVMLLIGVSLALYGQDVWTHLSTVFALFSAYLLVCLAFGGLIAVFATNREKANIFHISVTMASAITGGAFISLLWLPDSLKLVGRFLPTYWLNNGVITMYEGQFPFLSILVMIGMTGVVFLMTVLVLKKRPLTV